MKTSSSFNTGHSVQAAQQAGSKLMSDLASAARGKRVAQADVQFKLLFADIKPSTSFEDATARARMQRQEQQRIDRERERTPRAQDQIGMAHAEAQRPAEPQRTRRSEESGSVQEPARVRPRDERARAASESAQPTRRTEVSDEASKHVLTSEAPDGKTHAATEADSSHPVSASRPATAAQPAQTAQLAQGESPGTTTPDQAKPAAGIALPQGMDAEAEQLEIDLQAAQGAQDLRPVTEEEATQLAQAAGLVEATEADPRKPARMAAATAAETSTTTAQAQEAEGEPVQALAASARTDASSAKHAQAAHSGPQAGAASATAQSPHQQALHAAQGSTARPDDGALQDARTASTQSAGVRSVEGTAGSPNAAGMTGIATGRADGAAFSVGMAMPTAGTHSPVRPDGSPLLASRIDSPVNSAEFKEQFARQVADLTMKGQDRAEIRLTPAELGPIRIRVSLSANDAQVDISAAHAATRQAIEASIGTLKQLLGEQGMRLTDYRMDQNNTPSFLSQQRQSGGESFAGMQQSTTAFGQGDGQGQGSGREHGAGAAHRGDDTTDARLTAGTDPLSGKRSRGAATADSRLDLFA